MIGRERAEARAQCRAPKIGELIGVQAHGKSERARSREECAVSSGEKAICSQNASTASARPSAAMAGSMSRQEGFDVSALVALGFRGESVRSQKGRADIDRTFAPESPRGTQLPPLRLQFEATGSGSYRQPF